MLKINELFDLTHTEAAEYLSKFEYPWQALKEIKDSYCYQDCRAN